MIDYRKRAKIASVFFKIMGFILTFVLLLALISIISTKDFKAIPIFIIVALITVALFILSNVLKNKPEKLIPALNNTNDYDGKNTSYYKAEWFYNDVYFKYCKKYNVEEVTDEAEIKRVWEYTFNKLSAFLTWLIDRDFFAFEYEEIEEGARKLKAREITANEFFVVDCNMAFSKNEIKKGVIDFVNDYFYFGTHKYGSYEEDYNNFIKNTLHKDENEIVFNWDEYEQFKLVLDQAYDNYNKEAIAAKRLADSYKELSEASQEARAEADKLNSAISGYDDAVEKLEACTRGTEEWRDALKEVNKAAIEVIENLPENLPDGLTLSDIYDKKTGTFNQENLAKVQEKVEE